MLSLVSLITSSLNSLTGMPFMAVKQSSLGLCCAEGHCRYRTQAELLVSTSSDALLLGAPHICLQRLTACLLVPMLTE